MSHLVQDPTNRFHVTGGLFSNKSHITSNCGVKKKKNGTLPNFLVFRDLLLCRPTVEWNVFVLIDKKANCL